jgi:hypothetical protein
MKSIANLKVGRGASTIKMQQYEDETLKITYKDRVYKPLAANAAAAILGECLLDAYKDAGVLSNEEGMFWFDV